MCPEVALLVNLSCAGTWIYAMTKCMYSDESLHMTIIGGQQTANPLAGTCQT
jgi:hypothetical protein